MKDPKRAVRPWELLINWQSRKEVETSSQDIVMQEGGEKTFDKINM